MESVEELASEDVNEASRGQEKKERSLFAAYLCTFKTLYHNNLFFKVKLCITGKLASL